MKKMRISSYVLMLLPVLLLVSCGPVAHNLEQSPEALQIYPDYTSVTIPPNIAPMNFQVKNQGDDFYARITNSRGRTVRVRNRSGSMEIPAGAWRKLLNKDRGGYLTITVCRKTRGKGWERFAEVRNEIAKEEIDPFIAFRKILPANIIWRSMGIYQRSTENFREYPIMVNSLTDESCMNCHTFNAGDPKQMLLHMRGPYGGTLISNHDGVRLVDTKSDHTRAPGAYAAWHPNGELIAFSVNKINQGFHSKIGLVTYVVDKFSDIILYDVKANSVTRPAELATDKLESLPSWSPDGKTLYYICADRNIDTIPYWVRQYHLMSIGFDEQTREFGDADTLINAYELGKSISYPRESPRGGIISFVGVDYGYFAAYNRESDVYLYNTVTGEVSKPEINSEFADSYPSWSTNGAWLMFISKRDDDLMSEVFFSHIDEQGRAAKPFVLPQKHPDFYKEYLYNYNRPEFIAGKVNLNPRKIFRIAKKGADPSGFNAEASVSIATGATRPVAEETAGFYQHD
jgi:hypothetical protein